jgi:hypothetical protein
MQQLWMYIFGIHSCSDNQNVLLAGNLGEKGSDEVVSCLHHSLCIVPEGVTTLFLFSDGCPGQNKNSNVMHYLYTLVHTSHMYSLSEGTVSFQMIVTSVEQK